MGGGIVDTRLLYVHVFLCAYGEPINAPPGVRFLRSHLYRCEVGGANDDKCFSHIFNIFGHLKSWYNMVGQH